MKRTFLFLAFFAIVVPPAFSDNTKEFALSHLNPYIGVGFYRFKYYNTHVSGKIPHEIFPQKYTGVDLRLGIKPFRRIGFEFDYFKNGNDFQESIGVWDNKHNLKATSNLDFSVYSFSALYDLFYFHKNEISLFGVLNVDQINYKAKANVIYNNSSGYTKNLIEGRIEGKEMGPSIGIGLRYQPQNSRLSTDFRFIEYANNHHTKSDNMMIGIQYHF